MQILHRGIFMPAFGRILQLARMEEMDCEFVEVTAHEGARPTHAVWQGRVYHRGGAVVQDGERYEDFETATGYGTGPGLCGWNCRHNFYPFYPGISVRNYTDERLAELDARNIPYGGGLYTRYEITQMQRALERRVRKYKRRYLAETAAGRTGYGGLVFLDTDVAVFDILRNPGSHFIGDSPDGTAPVLSVFQGNPDTAGVHAVAAAHHGHVVRHFRHLREIVLQLGGYLVRPFHTGICGQLDLHVKTAFISPRHVFPADDTQGNHGSENGQGQGHASEEFFLIRKAPMKGFPVEPLHPILYPVHGCE